MIEQFFANSALTQRAGDFFRPKAQFNPSVRHRRK